VVAIIILVDYSIVKYETDRAPVLGKPTVLPVRESKDLNHWSKNNCLSPVEALYAERLLPHLQKLTVV
jgi:hypothetical protein